MDAWEGERPRMTKRLRSEKCRRLRSVEFRRSRLSCQRSATRQRPVSGFGLRISFGFRPSDFGLNLRASPLTSPGALGSLVAR